MKIAMVSSHAGPLARLGSGDGGGQSVVVDGLSRALAQLGHSVTVAAQRNDPSLPACLTTSAGVHVHHIDPAEFEAQLGCEWRSDRPDVVHAYGARSGAAALTAASALNIPLVQTFGRFGRRIDAQRRLDLTADELTLAGACARVVATSSAEVFALLGAGANPGAIKLIPTGVDLEQFAPRPHPAPVPGRQFRAVTLGRLTLDSGVGDVIEALQSIDGVELVAGGAASDRDASSLAALARACGVESRVTFRGRIARDDVPGFLAAADIAICVPWYDSIGTVALEAMASGVPVIVSTVGALVDIVADGMTGRHVPPRSPRQLAYALDELRSDLSRYDRFRRFGRERARERYGWPRIAGETLAVYASVIDRKVSATSGRA